MGNKRNEREIGICEAYKITTMGNFLRGLDRDIYTQIKDKEIDSLDTAIALANQADLQWKSWNRIHDSGKPNKIPEATGNCEKKYNVPKRITYVKTETNKSKEVEQARPSTQCYGCRQYGHIRRFCPQNINNNDNVKDGKIQGCGYCFRSNHTYNYCRVKIRYDEERTSLKRKFAGYSNSK